MSKYEMVEWLGLNVFNNGIDVVSAIDLEDMLVEGVKVLEAKRKL